MQAKLVIFGVALATTFLVSTHFLAGTNQLEVFALFLALTASVYGGSALTPAGTAYSAIELPFVFLVFVSAVAGLLLSPIWISIGYFGHGGWDLLHHYRKIKTPIIPAFPPICAVFDTAVGGFVLLWWLQTK